jgi:hypothetical protein
MLLTSLYCDVLDTAKVGPNTLEDITRVFSVHLKYLFKKYMAQVPLLLRTMAIKYLDKT